jgi:hypothetical protein
VERRQRARTARKKQQSRHALKRDGSSRTTRFTWPT